MSPKNPESTDELSSGALNISRPSLTDCHEVELSYQHMILSRNLPMFYNTTLSHKLLFRRHEKIYALMTFSGYRTNCSKSRLMCIHVQNIPWFQNLHFRASPEEFTYLGIQTAKHHTSLFKANSPQLLNYSQICDFRRLFQYPACNSFLWDYKT